MKDFTRNVLQIIENIPSGKVMTYGQIGSEAGSPKGARQVARLLHSMSAKYDLPWHRVINVEGRISMKEKDKQVLQENLLLEEGIEISDSGKIDLLRYRYDSKKDSP